MNSERVFQLQDNLGGWSARIQSSLKRKASRVKVATLRIDLPAWRTILAATSTTFRRSVVGKAPMGTVGEDTSSLKASKRKNPISMM